MPIQKIPIVLVTGELGSGKTALINALLEIDPWPDSALIINEAGESSIDHQLFNTIAYASENIVDGCICCDGGGTLIERIQELFWLHLTKRTRPLRQLLIEASGLSDPSQLYQKIAGDALIRSRFTEPIVLKMVDAQHVIASEVSAAPYYHILAKTDLLEAEALDRLQSATQLLDPSTTFHKPDFLALLAQVGTQWWKRFLPLRAPGTASSKVLTAHLPSLTIPLSSDHARVLNDEDLYELYVPYQKELIRLKAILENKNGEKRVVDIVRSQLYPSRVVPRPAEYASRTNQAGDARNFLVVFGERAALLRFLTDLRQWLSELSSTADAP